MLHHIRIRLLAVELILLGLAELVLDRVPDQLRPGDTQVVWRLDCAPAHQGTP